MAGTLPDSKACLIAAPPGQAAVKSRRQHVHRLTGAPQSSRLFVPPYLTHPGRTPERRCRIL
jgi:hypothetical protein